MNELFLSYCRSEGSIGIEVFDRVLSRVDPLLGNLVSVIDDVSEVVSEGMLDKSFKDS